MMPGLTPSSLHERALHQGRTRKRRERSLDLRSAVLATGLAGLLVALSWMLGQRVPLALSTSNLLMLGATLVLVVLAMLPGRGRLHAPPAAWLAVLAAVSLWLWLQAVPWAPLACLGPYPDWMWAMPEFRPSSWSPDPGATLAAWVRFMALFAIAWLARGLPRAAAGLVLLLLVAGAVVQALYGLIAHASGSTSILGIWERNNPNSVHGAFSNRNLYSAYLALCLPAAMTIWFVRGVPGVSSWSVGQRLAATVLATLLLAMAVAGSLSRGGMVAFLIAFAATLLLWRGRADRSLPPRLRNWALFGAIASLALAMLWYGIAPLLGRFLDDADTGRALVFRAVLADTPWQWWLTGVGIGGFEAAFRLIQPPELQAWLDHLHNDLLQWFFEAGVPVGLAVLLIPALAVWRSRDGSDLKAIAYAGLAAMLFVALVDFSWHIPATQAVIALYLGIALRPKRRNSASPAERPELFAEDGAGFELGVHESVGDVFEQRRVRRRRRSSRSRAAEDPLD